MVSVERCVKISLPGVDGLSTSVDSGTSSPSLSEQLLSDELSVAVVTNTLDSYTNIKMLILYSQINKDNTNNMKII